MAPDLRRPRRAVLEAWICGRPKVVGACNLPTVPIDPNVAEYIGGDQVETGLGAPAPVRAMLPTGKEAMSFHEMRHRNKAALTLGRWRLLPANDETAEKAAERGGFVCNGDLVYLEQDFFHVTMSRDGSTSLERVPKVTEYPGYRWSGPVVGSCGLPHSQMKI